MIESGPSLGEPTELTPGVFTLVAQPDAVTIGIVAGRDGCLVVDTGSSPEQGEQIRRLATELTGRPVVAAVVTHAHRDHAHGLAAFADLPTYGHESVAAAEGMTEMTAPNRPLAVAAALDLGERRVEIAHLGRGHTEGDLLVVLPEAGVVFAGDLLEQASPPWFGADSVPAEWAATLDGLIGLMTETSRAVPGHGDPVDREFVFEQRGQIAAVAGEIARLAALGTDPTTAAEQGSWPFPVEHIRDVLPTALAHDTSALRQEGRRQLPMA